MAREQSPERHEAYRIYKDSGGKIANREIANLMGISEKTIGGWKCKDKWTEQMSGVLKKKERSTPLILRSKPDKKRNKGGAPKGSKNAIGNKGGAAPLQNHNAAKHGLFRQYLPDDEETRNIYDSIGKTNPIDILWENIQIKFTAIIRAQKIMFVRDEEDETKILKREKETATGWENEYELQLAWDKQAAFMNAQSRAMSALGSLIRQYEEMCRLGWADEEQQLKIQKLKAEVKTLNKETMPDPVVFKDDLHE